MLRNIDIDSIVLPYYQSKDVKVFQRNQTRQNWVFEDYCKQDLELKDGVNSEMLHLEVILSHFPLEIDIWGQSFPRMNECQSIMKMHKNVQNFISSCHIVILNRHCFLLFSNYLFYFIIIEMKSFQIRESKCVIRYDLNTIKTKIENAKIGIGLAMKCSSMKRRDLVVLKRRFRCNVVNREHMLTVSVLYNIWSNSTYLKHNKMCN